MIHTIQNRYGLDVVIEHTRLPDEIGLAFLLHGLSGFKEQPHIRAMADAFHKKRISTVNIDATHSFNESDGNLIDATLTNHYHDLVDAIRWAEKQPWFQSPFYLAGHSLGSGALLHYASNYPDDVQAIAPTSTIVSGALWKSATAEEKLQKWQQKGYYEKNSKGKPNAVGKVSWDLMQDAQQYDFTKQAKNLNMPALFLVRSEDETTPPAHQKILYKNWDGDKVYHEIEGSAHTFRKASALVEIRSVFGSWLDKIT